MDSFSQPVRGWFADSFPGPTRVQELGWPVLARGRNALLVAPTGSGKTLAAFLWAIDRLSFDRPHESEAAAAREPGVRVLYVSPLKALVYDIERNLDAPLAGVRRVARKLGVPVRPVTVDVRTGDTTPQERRRQLRRPGEILVTTPESLFLILGSRAAANLRTVETVIVDEVHAMAATKRGAHLALSLERLAELTGDREPQRIGLSATVRPMDLAAEFLGGDRPVEVVDASEPPRIDLEVVVPVPDMEAPPAPDFSEDGDGWPRGLETSGLWPSVYPRILEAVRSHKSTIVFVNSRSLCERLAQRLNDLAALDDRSSDTSDPEPLARAHHGSISHEQRREIEESLKAGRLRCIVATSSLELGIDMGAVDLVLLVEAPGSAVRGLQRVGRAGHAVGERSRGLIFPKFRGDLLECTVTAIQMLRGAIESMRLPENPLDVLAQQIVAMCCDRERTVDDLLGLARRSRSYRDLSRGMLTAVLNVLVGRYPSEEFANLRPRLSWDHGRGVLTARRGAALLVRLNAGTIPDRGMFTVHLGPDGPRLGELDEEMVYESRAGDTFLLGAAAWRVTEITRDRVIVRPAPGEPGRMPFWHGDGPGRPVELGQALGAFVRELGRRDADDARRFLAEETPLDRYAAANLFAYVDEQRNHTGTLPTDRALTIERFRDEIGDWRVCILTPFGSRIHAPWAMALERRFSERTGVQVQTLWNDDGLALRFADVDDLPPAREFLLDACEVEELVTDQVASTPMFASRFRENAARALLLPRNRPGKRTPLWQQRQRSKNLLSVARRYPDFPVLLETYRECMSDLFDLSGLVDLMSKIEDGAIRIDDVETPSPSPFARSLVFAYEERFLYDDDAPAAERRAQALTLDRELLRELLGTSSLKELLDEDVIQAVDGELQGLATGRAPRHEDDLYDLLRHTGGLTRGEAEARAPGDADNWLFELERQKRAVEVDLADGRRIWVAVEDAALYRDGLDADLPDGLPADLLAARPAPLEALVRRFARSRGPFASADAAGRFGLPQGAVEPLLAALEDAGALVHGEFRAGRDGFEWCDREILRQIKRRTLAKLRREAAPVDGPALARFLGRWQGTGELLWVGRGRLGPRDGRVAVYGRDRFGLLVRGGAEPATGTADAAGGVNGDGPEAHWTEGLHRAVLQRLETRGACFTFDLVRGVVGAGDWGETEVEAAIWDLVWAGRITNDTFLPLESLGKRRRPAAERLPRGLPRGWRRGPGRTGSSGALQARPFAPRRGRAATLAGGRWSLVAGLAAPGEPVSDTKWAHATATMLLDRYGVVAADTARAENVPGGFEALYPVLREMEEVGYLRRGYFVHGLAGRQFALPVAVERLRRERRAPGNRGPIEILPAVDPANPWGAVMPWPQLGTEAEPGRAGPRRIPRAWLVQRAGTPSLFLEAGGQGVWTFAALGGDPAPNEAWAALRDLAGRRRRRSLRLLRIDGRPAAESSWAPTLAACGFEKDPDGYRVSRLLPAV